MHAGCTPGAQDEAACTPTRQHRTARLDDDSCDCALSTFTLCTIPDVNRALAELRRVCCGPSAAPLGYRDRMPAPQGNDANSVGVLVDESGRRHRWLRRWGSAISLLCVLFMLSVVASVFAPDGFVGLSLPVVAPAGTTPALPQAVQAPLPTNVLAPVTTPAPTTAKTTPTAFGPTTTIRTKPGNGPPTTFATPSGTTSASPTTTTVVTTTTKPRPGPPSSKPGQGSGRATTIAP